MGSCYAVCAENMPANAQALFEQADKLLKERGGEEQRVEIDKSGDGYNVGFVSRDGDTINFGYSEDAYFRITKGSNWEGCNRIPYYKTEMGTKITRSDFWNMSLTTELEWKEFTFDASVNCYLDRYGYTDFSLTNPVRLISLMLGLPTSVKESGEALGCRNKLGSVLSEVLGCDSRCDYDESVFLPNATTE